MVRQFKFRDGAAFFIFSFIDGWIFNNTIRKPVITDNISLLIKYIIKYIVKYYIGKMIEANNLNNKLFMQDLQVKNQWQKEKGCITYSCRILSRF